MSNYDQSLKLNPDEYYGDIRSYDPFKFPTAAFLEHSNSCGGCEMCTNIFNVLREMDEDEQNDHTKRAASA